MADNQIKEVKDLVLVTLRDRREGILFEGEAKAVSSYNDRGIFDMLGEHENFISLVKDKVVIHTKNGQDKEVKIDNGVISVYKNQIRIYIGL